MIYPGENHFKSLVQLTNGGENAEAYWSFDDTKLVLQRTDPSTGVDCDQIYYGPVTGVLEKGTDFILAE